MKNKFKHNRGFTLMETIIYIALFSLLMGSGFVIAYQIIDGSSKLNVKNTLQEEGNFVMRKLNWTLTSIESVTTPNSSTPNSANLAITKYDGNMVAIQLDGNKIEIKESTNGNIFIPITTDNVSVSDLRFAYIPKVGKAPAGITATTIINGASFTITKYFRK